MKDTLNFTQIILGETGSIKLFSLYMLFALFGLIFSLLLELYKSEIKPEMFSWKYYWNRNRLRLLLNLLAMIAGVLFTKDLLQTELSLFTSFLAGFTSDKILEVLKSKMSK